MLTFQCLQKFEHVGDVPEIWIRWGLETFLGTLECLELLDDGYWMHGTYRLSKMQPPVLAVTPDFDHILQWSSVSYLANIYIYVSIYLTCGLNTIHLELSHNSLCLPLLSPNPFTSDHGGFPGPCFWPLRDVLCSISKEQLEWTSICVAMPFNLIIIRSISQIS